MYIGCSHGRKTNYLTKLNFFSQTISVTKKLVKLLVGNFLVNFCPSPTMNEVVSRSFTIEY